MFTLFMHLFAEQKAAGETGRRAKPRQGKVQYQDYIVYCVILPGTTQYILLTTVAKKQPREKNEAVTGNTKKKEGRRFVVQLFSFHCLV